MRTYVSSARSFNIRSLPGSVLPPLPSFSCGFVSDVGGAYAQVSDDEVVAAALRILSDRVVRSNPLTNPRATREYLAVRFAGLEHEVVACVYLDCRHRVLTCEELFRGTIDGAVVHPREVVKQALICNAAAVILVHNHPSGSAEPSQADEVITRRLREALALVDIRLIDHLVVGGGVTTSMAERGLV